MGYNIDELVNNYFDNSVTKLQKLIQIDSKYDESTKNSTAPFGEGVKECLHTFLNMAENDGFITKNIDNYAGYAEIGSGDLIGVLAHLDVVPEGDISKWKYHPYKAEIHNNKLYGRGSVDDKGPLMAAYTALQILKDNFKLNKRFRIIAGCDEETSMRCLKRYKETEEIPVFSFSPDSNFPAINGEKGQLHIILKRDFELQGYEPIKLLGLTAGQRVNIVPDSATAYFTGNIAMMKRQLEEIAGDDLEFEFMEENYLKVTAYGKSTHAMHPEEGENAIYKLFHYLSHQSLDFGPWELMHWLRSTAYLFDNKNITKNFNLDIKDEISGNLTLNIGIMRYKGKDFQLNMDIRYPVTYNPNKMESKLQNIAERIMMLMQIKSHLHPLYISEDNIYLQELLKAYNLITNENGKPYAIGGRTYCALMPNSLSFGAQFPNEKELAHEVNEYIDLDSMKKAVKIYLQSFINLNNL